MPKRFKPGMIATILGAACVVAIGALLLHPDSDSSQALGSPAKSAGTPDPGNGKAIDPSRFAAGACEEFSPTSGDAHQTVFLDAGHGGMDPGGVGQTQSGTQVDESTVNLAIELDTAAVLRAQGYTVVVSRTGNTTVTRLGAGDTDGSVLSLQGAHDDVAARDICANMANATVLVGIYMDAGAAGAAGCLTGYDPDRPFSAQNERLADLLQEDVLGAMDTQGWDIPDGSVKPDTGLGSSDSAAAQSYDHLMLLGPAEAGYFETPSQMPGALIEPLFLTDPFDGSIAASANGQQVIAGALAKAIRQYLVSS
jgi:N-acetylmuramoyl-L-alanine amidase